MQTKEKTVEKEDHQQQHQKKENTTTATATIETSWRARDPVRVGGGGVSWTTKPSSMHWNTNKRSYGFRSFRNHHHPHTHPHTQNNQHQQQKVTTRRYRAMAPVLRMPNVSVETVPSNDTQCLVSLKLVMHKTCPMQEAGNIVHNNKADEKTASLPVLAKRSDKLMSPMPISSNTAKEDMKENITFGSETWRKTLIEKFHLTNPMMTDSKQDANIMFDALEHAYWYCLDTSKTTTKTTKNTNTNHNNTNDAACFMRFFSWIMGTLPSPQVWEQYKRYIEFKKTIPVAGVLLLSPNSQEILMIQPENQACWTFPKGKIEDKDAQGGHQMGDRLHDLTSAALWATTAAREASEEVGYEIDVQTLTEKCFYIHIDRADIGQGDVRLFVVRNVPRTYPFQIRCQGEVKQFEWVALEACPCRPMASLAAIVWSRLLEL